MWPSGRRPLGKSDSRTNSGRVRSSSRERVKREPLNFVSKAIRLDLRDRKGIPQIETDVFIGSGVEGVDGWGSALRDLGDDARGTSGLSHEVGEAGERTGAFGVGWRRLAVVGSFGGRFGVGRESGLGLLDD